MRLKNQQWIAAGKKNILNSPIDNKHVRFCTFDNYIDNNLQKITKSQCRAHSNPSIHSFTAFGINDLHECEAQSKHCVNKRDGIHHQFYKLIFDYFLQTHAHTLWMVEFYFEFFFLLHIFDIDADPDELVIPCHPTVRNMFALSIFEGFYEGWTMEKQTKNWCCCWWCYGLLYVVRCSSVGL